eukprot:1545570-Lingulodinium_polyedra.AAC.1
MAPCRVFPVQRAAQALGKRLRVSCSAAGHVDYDVVECHYSVFANLNGRRAVFFLFAGASSMLEGLLGASRQGRLGIG